MDFSTRNYKLTELLSIAKLNTISDLKVLKLNTSGVNIIHFLKDSIF